MKKSEIEYLVVERYLVQLQNFLIIEDIEVLMRLYLEVDTEIRKFIRKYASIHKDIKRTDFTELRVIDFSDESYIRSRINKQKYCLDLLFSFKKNKVV